jgi:hypothetical protein
LARQEFREFRDDFLVPLRLEMHQAALRDFWPVQGPQWDALALLPADTATGVLLVEAKAHPGETVSACGATSPASLAKIEAAFALVQGFMRISHTVTPADWMSGSYQLANRLAYLYFLNEIVRVPTFLALVNFVDDRTHRPTSVADWQQHQQSLFRSLGIHADCRMLDRVVTVYPTAIENGR